MADRRHRLLEIVEEIQPATVRQVFYQATLTGVVEKTEGGYDKVQRALVDMRLDGTIPFDWLVDNTRWMRKPRTYGSKEEALQETARLYRRDLWCDADEYVEIWIEKDALAGVIYPVTEEFDVPLMVARGYASLSFLHDAAELIADQERPAYIYHLGDYDPSGQDAARNIEEQLREMAPDAEIYFKQLAVTRKQIARWKLPTRPTKTTDTRSKAWTGGESVELDAIAPDDLRKIVRDAIETHVNREQLELLLEIERDEREQFMRLSPPRFFPGDDR